MKSLLSIEVENSLIQKIYQSEDGYVAKLSNNLILFITDNKIGLFDRTSIDLHKADFSKIDISTIHLLQQEDFTHDSGASVQYN